jgi:hypothetical protein
MSFAIGAIMNTKKIHKTLIELGQTIEDLDVMKVLGNHSTLFGSNCFPSLETINPRIALKYIMNAHFFELKLILYS